MDAPLPTLAVGDPRPESAGRSRPAPGHTKLGGLVLRLATGRLALSLSGLLVLLVLWAAGVALLGDNLPMARLFSPFQALPTLIHLLAENQLTLHTLVSLRRVAVGLF